MGPMLLRALHMRVGRATDAVFQTKLRTRDKKEDDKPEFEFGVI